MPVAVKMTGVSEPTDAVNVFGPAPAPRLHEPTVAIPDASVVTDPPVTEPPPAVTTKFTDTPAIGTAFWSVTSTDGAGETTLLTAPASDVVVVAASVVGTGGSTELPPSQAMNASATAAAVNLSPIRADFFM